MVTGGCSILLTIFTHASQRRKSEEPGEVAHPLRISVNVGDLADVFNRGETKDFRQSVGVMVINSEIIEISTV